MSLIIFSPLGPKHPGEGEVGGAVWQFAKSKLFMMKKIIKSLCDKFEKI